MNWFIKVRDTIYGPYGLDRMQKFAEEGRVSTRTQVSRNPDSGFGPAAGDAELMQMLKGEPLLTQPAPKESGTSVFAAYVTVSDDKVQDFGDALSQFGPVIRPLPHVWLVKGVARVETLRNVLSRQLGGDETMVLFEVNGNQGAWFNIGQRADRQIREFFGSD